MDFMGLPFIQQEAVNINETHSIIQCIISNKLDKLKLLLKKHDINGLYPCEELNDVVSPLIAAVAFQKEEFFSVLVNEAADPNTYSQNFWTPLHYASLFKVPIHFVHKLLVAKADPNGKSNNQINLMLTPLQTAAFYDRHDIGKALIGAGAIVVTCALTFPLQDAYNDKFCKMVHRLASNGFLICSEIRHFVDLDIALEQKSPEEVFQLFDHVMLLRHPQTHFSILDVMLGVAGQVQEEYQSKAIQWLRDHHKINQYIEEAVKHFPNLLKGTQLLVVENLHSVFCTLTEIPINISLAFTPILLELLSTKVLFPEEPNLVVLTLYVIAQKTKVKDDWDWHFIKNLGSGISDFLINNHSATAMYAYGILANLLSTEHANRMFTSIGLTSVPEGILTFAERRMDDVLKKGLRHLHKYLVHPSPVLQDSISADEELLAPKKKKKNKKKKKKEMQQNDELHNASSDLSTASVQESVANDLQPGNTTFRKEQKWLKRSVRWREKLEKLSKSEEIIKVGSILFVNDEEYRIATGSDGTEVFLGLREDGTEVAVKRMSKTNDNVLKNEESFLRLPELEHENIVRYMDYAKDSNFGYLALQLCEFTLEEFLRPDLTEKQKRNLVTDVLSSLSVLHGQTPQILHRDIKPQNVLIDVHRKARLADFGISRTLPKGQTSRHTKKAGTKSWMARENIDEDVDVPCKMSADIQVAGMLTYYILSGGHHPFGRGCRCESNILDGLYSLDHVQDLIAKDLVKWMINKNPIERPTVQQCLAHPFFWSTSRKIDYLKSIGNEEEVRNYKATDKRLLDELDRDVGEASWKDWKQKFPPELVQKMDGKGKYSENTAGLIRFIRNLLEHYPEDAEHIDLMATFPDLFGGVYVFAKNKGWNSRVSLRRMFQRHIRWCDEHTQPGGPGSRLLCACPGVRRTPPFSHRHTMNVSVNGVGGRCETWM
uniref:Serine/threonine-protein kinase/endoribonuclease IRE1-like n=1 Tax=Gadus morhua TaxID=8049 RepID=A0A8C5AAX1_GADMO